MTVHERKIANKCVDKNASRVKRPFDPAGSVKKNFGNTCICNFIVILLEIEKHRES